MCSTETGCNCVGQNEEGNGESMCKIDAATEGCIHRCGQRVNKRDTRLGLNVSWEHWVCKLYAN